MRNNVHFKVRDLRAAKYLSEANPNRYRWENTKDNKRVLFDLQDYQERMCLVTGDVRRVYKLLFSYSLEDKNE